MNFRIFHLRYRSHAKLHSSVRSEEREPTAVSPYIKRCLLLEMKEKHVFASLPFGCSELAAWVFDKIWSMKCSMFYNLLRRAILRVSWNIFRISNGSGNTRLKYQSLLPNDHLVLFHCYILITNSSREKTIYLNREYIYALLNKGIFENLHIKAWFECCS